MLLVNLLILFFLLLICYQIFLATFYSHKEGMTSSSSSTDASGSSYQSYNTNDPNNALILAQQNAGNISYLQQQLQSLLNLKNEVEDLSGNVSTLQTQVSGVIAAQSQYSSQLTAAGPPNVTGTGAPTSTNSNNNSSSTS